MAEHNIKGLDQLLKNLKTLPAELNKKVFQSATSSAASTIARQARKEAPYGRGVDASKTTLKTKKKVIHLRDTIRIAKRINRAGNIRYTVHAGRGIRYAHLVEFGSAPHTIFAKGNGYLSIGRGYYKSVSHPGSKANPFMRRAFDKANQKAIDNFKKAGQRRIEKLRLKL